MMNQPQPIRQETVFSGKIIETRVDTVLLPNGAQVTREVVSHPGAVAIVPIDAEDNVLMVRQYRYPVGQSLLEIPAGTLEEGGVARRYGAARASRGSRLRGAGLANARRDILRAGLLHRDTLHISGARSDSEQAARRR